MTLLRWEGRLLRTSGGLLTHDADCCCVEEDCVTAPCGSPSISTVTVSGVAPFEFDDPNCCIGFNGEYNFTWVYHADCDWRINETLWLDWEDPGTCFVDGFGNSYEWASVVGVGLCVWDNANQRYSWQLSITLRYVEPLAGAMGPPFPPPWERSVSIGGFTTGATGRFITPAGCAAGDSVTDAAPNSIFGCLSDGSALFDIEF